LPRSEVEHALLAADGRPLTHVWMRALFVAHDPSFKQHLTLPVFDDTNVYVLLARLTGLSPVHNEGGSAVTAGVPRKASLPSSS